MPTILKSTPASTPASHGAKQRTLALASYMRQPHSRGGEVEDGPPELVAHADAFLAKCHADLESLMAAPESDKHARYTTEAELMLDVAIGKALLRECQPATDDAVKSGDMRQAKVFSDLSHRLRKAVSYVQKVISDAGRSDADRLADAMTEQPREDASATGGLDRIAREIAQEHDRGKRAARLRRQVLSQVRLPSRTEVLVTTLVCVLLLCVGLVKLPQALDREPRRIEKEDFAGTNVLEVVARPPSLYVTLDAAGWEMADTATRESMLNEVVSVPLVNDDYRGAMIKTSEGRPVAVWIRSTGIRLLEASEPVAPPAAVQKAAIFVP